MFFKRLFAKSGVYAAYKMYSPAHFMLIMICAAAIFYALYQTRAKTKDEILKTVRKCAIVLWVLEAAKIIFNLCIGNAGNLNTYIPLYFCSITLYACVFSGYCKGFLKRVGDVFLIVGGVVGGCAYILSPCTTAGTYPVFHFITIQSFLLHSIMIYLGILFVITDYAKLSFKDIYYYAPLVVTVSIIAYIINMIFGSNLMFVSQSNPGTIVDVVYKMNPKLFSFSITFWQAVPPFIVIHHLTRLYYRIREKKNAQNKEVAHAVK